jgi:hypothetical protein
LAKKAQSGLILYMLAGMTVAIYVGANDADLDGAGAVFVMTNAADRNQVIA